ncbi:hypothetical protein NTE_00576 [Candidatus Nitrososphaera evergladensis SR1]|uniref:Uncharacterized protein n=1 Tax=Candidatus Nitrososphaera evergladensis SR1 TaxID=1459636 RepID=A0A075MPD9_9ARCH|nr:hypothetical protein [Candidatus Nitrososphaera evergladensis]AIF82657.1 hypothetical protein NTE_00576 [Candidatus Nitrososphaera evergladensis SR1]
MSISTSSRPMGVTILAILNVIGGIVMLLVGLGVAVLGVALIFLAPVGIFFGGIFAILGIVSFVVAGGLLQGSGWAWTATLILSIISIVIGVASLAAGNASSIISVIISAAIIYYLYRPYVMAYFGKSTKRIA